MIAHYPVTKTIWRNNDQPILYRIPQREMGNMGLTKREYFAAAALQGLAAVIDLTHQDRAENAVYLADLLIAELEKSSAES